jgi:hypothetical protein
MFVLHDEDRIALNFMCAEVVRLYKDCSQERGKLHKIEWNAGEDAPSVLMDAELSSTMVSGTASSCLHYSRLRRRITREEFEKHWNWLAEYSVYDSKTLTHWMIHESAKYPVFAAYLQAVECLRVISVKILAANRSGGGVAEDVGQAEA